MVRRWVSLVGWPALVWSAVFSGSTANASAAPRDVDADDHALAATPPVPSTTRVRFTLAPSHDGIRTLVLDEDSGRRTPLGDVPADATCETYASPASDFRPYLRIWCGGELEVWVLSEPEGLGIRGQYDFLHEGPVIDDDLPLPEGTSVELDPTLDDPEPPSCGRTHEREVALSLERTVRPADGRYEIADLQLRSNFGPIEAHMYTPGCKRTCVGKGEATGHHYEYVCRCTSEPYEGSMTVRVRGGRLYVEEIERMPCSGRGEVKGIWALPCGAHLEYPKGTQIVSYHEDYFDDAPEELQAKAAEYGDEWDDGSWR